MHILILTNYLFNRSFVNYSRYTIFPSFQQTNLIVPKIYFSVLLLNPENITTELIISFGYSIPDCFVLSSLENKIKLSKLSIYEDRKNLQSPEIKEKLLQFIISIFKIEF
jgi:hypothetical protein